MNQALSPSSAVAVAVAVLRDSNGCVLLCRRPDSARYAGKWEFPGGKLEAGETPEEALRRELNEELGIDSGDARLLYRHNAHYDDGGHFDVGFYVVEQWIGTPQNLASSELAWVAPDELARYDILDGSRDVCRLLVDA